MWPLIIIVALVAVPVVVGFLMPVRYVGSTIVEYDRGVQLVWDALQDVTAQPEWRLGAKGAALFAHDGDPWQHHYGGGASALVASSC